MNHIYQNIITNKIAYTSTILLIVDFYFNNNPNFSILAVQYKHEVSVKFFNNIGQGR